MRAAAVSLVAIAMGPVANALATPPNVTIESPVTGSVSNDRTPSFSGSTDDIFDEVTVRIYPGSGVKEGEEIQTLGEALPLSGTWSVGPAATLADGVYTAQASQTSLGETGSSEPVTFKVDTSSPTVTLDTPTSPSNNTTPSFTGFASDTTPVTVQIYAGSTASGSVVSTATAATGGSWASGPASPDLPSGKYTAVATQESSLGNPPGTSSSVTFTVDTSSPDVTLNQPKSPSNETTPSFTGFASDTEPVTVQIYAGAAAEGAVVSTATATGTGGGWTSGHASPALPSGEYTAVATQESSLGNPAGTSSPVTFTVDTSSPVVTLDQPTSPSNHTTPSFTGTASGSSTVTVQIFAGGAAEGSVVSTAKATGTGGAWTSGNASPSLPSGLYTARAVQESPLGNPPGVSQSRTFRVETAAPTVTLTSPALQSNNTTPSFTGTASDPTEPVTVQIYAGSTASGSVVSTAKATGTGGAWTSGNASPALTNGQYTATATQKSSLGNPAGHELAGDVRGEHLGAHGDDRPAEISVQQHDPVLHGHRQRPHRTGHGPDLRRSHSKRHGRLDGQRDRYRRRLDLRQREPGAGQRAVHGDSHPESSLGNPAGTSSPVTFTVNTSAPTVTLKQPKSPSNNTTPSFTGTASDPTEPVTVQIYAGATASGSVVSTATATGTGGTWTSGNASPALPNGQFTATATQKSSLGNPAGTSSAVTFTVNTASPTVTLSQPKSPSNDTTPSFTGTANDELHEPVTVRIYDATEVEVASAKVTPGAKGEWTAGQIQLCAVERQTHLHRAGHADELARQPARREPARDVRGGHRSANGDAGPADSSLERRDAVLHRHGERQHPGDRPGLPRG